MELILGSIPVIAVALVAVIVVFILVRKSIRTVDLNEALVIVGRNDVKGGPTGSLDALPTDGVVDGRGPRVVIGGRTFVKPFFESVTKISLEQRQLSLTVEGVDKNFIGVGVRASVLFKVRGDADGVRRAAQRFTSQQAKLEQPLQQALEGALRPVLGSMTVEQLISDREALQKQVLESIRPDLHQQGFHIDLVNLSDITTPGSDYLSNLGRAQAAQARQVAEVREAEARLASEAAQIETQERIAERQRDLALKQAAIKAQTDRAEAEAQAAGQLARAEQDRVVAAQEREALQEKSKVAEQQLDIDVRKPADAAAYAAAKQAEGERDARNAETEAQAFERRTLADAELAAQRNEADAITALGNARAEAAKAEGLAKAAATEAQANALAEQGDVVIMQQLVGVLPEIVRAAAEPVGQIDNITVVSTDGAGAVSKIAGQVLGEGREVVSALTGLDLTKMFAGLAVDGPSPAVVGESNDLVDQPPATAEATQN
ncbi:SPFH domain-containing protein [Georgenia subflava]|uniref:Flotillin family protein n=1 Tax=Georgenia subflava TaxID=1622177 RepID=A0A6N7EJZ2_9MICO|nr:flotillin family protein [Georgenia subflava]MPV37097.1 flotillin family protein [Georgenia subflava]